jgi:hypothetical protein
MQLSEKLMAKLILTLSVGVGCELFSIEMADTAHLLQRHLKTNSNLCKLLIQDPSKGQQLIPLIV